MKTPPVIGKQHEAIQEENEGGNSEKKRKGRRGGIIKMYNYGKGNKGGRN